MKITLMTQNYCVRPKIGNKHGSLWQTVPYIHVVLHTTTGSTLFLSDTEKTLCHSSIILPAKHSLIEFTVSSAWNRLLHVRLVRRDIRSFIRIKTIICNYNSKKAMLQ